MRLTTQPPAHVHARRAATALRAGAPPCAWGWPADLHAAPHAAQHVLRGHLAFAEHQLARVAAAHALRVGTASAAGERARETTARGSREHLATRLATRQHLATRGHCTQPWRPHAVSRPRRPDPRPSPQLYAGHRACLESRGCARVRLCPAPQLTSLSSFCAVLKPGMPFSMRKAVMPLGPAAGSVLAYTTSVLAW
jgi:hypothetical protein